MKPTLPAAALSLLIALLSACSGSGEDVRVTLCKDIVRLQLGGESPTWTGVSTRTPGHEPAAINLSWAGGAAVCRYDYNAVDDTAMALSDPLSSYSASPSSVTINGQSLSRPALADAIKRAMIGQARGAVDSVKKALQQ